jgi:GAF domain-containing protein
MSPSVPAFAEDAAVRDPARLAEIARLGLATGSDDAVLRAALRDAGERCGAPIALVNIVLDDAAAILAAHGLAGWAADATGTPVEWSLCRHTVARRGVFVVADAARDAHTRDNPLVRYDGVGSYAGAPLVTSRGHVVGALCVLGPAPRPFSGAQLATLRRLADVVVRHLEERAAAPRSP